MNIEQLKHRVETLQEEYNVAKANLQVIVERMAEYGYNSVEELEQHLKKLHKQISAEQKEIEDAIAELENKYPDL